MVTKRRIKIPIFEYPITIYVFDEWSDLNDILPLELYANKCRGLTLEYDWECTVFVTPKFMSTIAHEALHITNLIWKSINYTPQRDNDEVSAYLMTYIIDKINNVVDKHTDNKVS